MPQFGKMLMVLGLVLVVAGAFLTLGPRRLPGDIVIRRPNFVFYFPLATSILISLILTLILWLVSRR